MCSYPRRGSIIQSKGCTIARAVPRNPLSNYPENTLWLPSLGNCPKPQHLDFSRSLKLKLLKPSLNDFISITACKALLKTI